jgi:hypothetical protein
MAIETSDYKARHAKTLARTSIQTTARKGHETAIVAMYKAWLWYAIAHKTASQGEYAIGDDGVLGEPWRDIGVALLALLNGETGPDMDCGTMDHDIREALAAHGIDTSEL